MEDVICVIAKSTTGINNVFEIRDINPDTDTVEEYCYFRHVHHGETILLLLESYLEPNLIEVGADHFVVCMEFHWLIKFINMVIDNDNEWHDAIDDIEHKVEHKDGQKNILDVD